jgi:protein involved in sex pheromone biosynthesis
MSRLTVRSPARAIVAALAAVALLAGCGSSGGDAKSTVDQIAAKLGAETSLADMKTAIPDAQFTAYVRCVAQFIHDKGKGSDVDAWVNGDKSIDEVRGFTSESNAQKAGQDCLTQAGVSTGASTPTT